MSRIIFAIGGVFFLFAAASGLAQESQPSAPPVPAATRSEIECTGFIAATRVPEDIVVFNGEDNPLDDPLRLFTAGEHVFLRNRSGSDVAVGAEFRIVRVAKEIFRTYRYNKEHSWVHSLGQPYEDVGVVKVTSVTPDALVAQATFTCTPILIDDLAIPFQARPVPQYTPSAQFDAFALPNGKLIGMITAAKDNLGGLGTRNIVYVNLGEGDGARVGQKYRIFQIKHDRPRSGLSHLPETPRESIGQLVILTTQERSSVGIIVASTGDVFLGDGVELME